MLHCGVPHHVRSGISDLDYVLAHPTLSFVLDTTNVPPKQVSEIGGVTTLRVAYFQNQLTLS
jgi:hypothetical protein